MSALYPWQENDWQRLQALRARPPQGLLFKGNKGVGELELAINFAHALLCQQPHSSGMACGTCPACHWLSQGAHPDFRLVQPDAISLAGEETETGKKPSKQISVEQIRELADFLSLSAHQGGKRVIIIYPAEAMNHNAANALLKSLEEPPRDMLFIVVTHKAQQLLPTILSRCVAFNLTMPDVATATAWLQTQGVKQPETALARAGFAPLLALQGDAQTGLDEREKLLAALRQPSVLDVFSLAEMLQKTEQVLVVQWLQQWSFDLSAMKLAGSVRYHMQDAAAIKKLVAAVEPLALARLQKLLQTAKREAQHTLNPKLFFESLLLAYRQLLTA
ncbi:MAG: DNA polymerase III subunit delta' [Sideroxydans sp.]|nr:DNA polymerase III subunit delta' [Sideroxydans sp.]